MPKSVMSLKRQIFNYAMAYIMLVFSTLFGALVLSIARDALLLSMVFSVKDEDQRQQFYQSLRLGAVAQWSYLAIGLIILILLIGLEHLYRTGASDGTIWRSFFMVTGAECAVLFVSHAASFAMQSAFGAQSLINVALPILEAMLAGLFFWLAFNLDRVTGRMKQQSTP